MKIKNKKGISLVTLVITIAILVILTSISIGAIGENGIIAKAKKAKKQEKILSITENINTEILEYKTLNTKKVSDSDIENIIYKYGEKKIDNEDRKCVEIEGELVPISQFGLNDMITTYKDGNWSIKQQICTPKLGKGMKAVYWDEEDNEIVQDDEKFDIKNWYNYKENIDNENDSRWANAKTTDGSYWVWIPRYAYKITYYTDSAKTILSPNNEFTLYGIIDVKFIDIGTKLTDEEKEEGYKIHPAFEDGSINGKNNNYMNGEWDKELSGIWVAKYEMSREVSTDNGIIWNVASSVDGEVKENKSRTVSKPNILSWRCISIGNAYTNCRLYCEKLNSHLMKNSEWGAIAYLTHSKYGRNGVEIETNKSFITSNGGVLTSTTGNITGIYDLSGGGWEFVSIYVSNGNTSLSNGSSFIDDLGKIANVEGYKTQSTKYVTVYPYDESEANYKLYKSLRNESYGYGDALCETVGWNKDNAVFINESFLVRGGGQDYVVTDGLFCFRNVRGNAGGNAGQNNSFRAVLAF